MSEKKTLWGIPVVVSDEMPKGEAMIGYFPTAEELVASGLSLDDWIKEHPRSFCKVTNLETE